MPGMFINLRVETSTSRFCINRVSRDAKGAESVQRVQREVVMRGDHMIRSMEKMHFPLRRAGRPRAHINSKASAGYAYTFLPPLIQIHGSRSPSPTAFVSTSILTASSGIYRRETADLECAYRNLIREGSCSRISTQPSPKFSSSLRI